VYYERGLEIWEATRACETVSRRYRQRDTAAGQVWSFVTTRETPSKTAPGVSEIIRTLAVSRGDRSERISRRESTQSNDGGCFLPFRERRLSGSQV